MHDDILQTDFDPKIGWKDVVQTFRQESWSDGALNKVEGMAVEFQGDDDNAMFWRTLHAVIDAKGDKGSETAYEVPVRLQATCCGLFLYFFWGKVRFKPECGLEELECWLTVEDMKRWDALTGKAAEDRYNKFFAMHLPYYWKKRLEHEGKAQREAAQRVQLRSSAKQAIRAIAHSEQ